jgi:hypothetical protein
MDENGRTLRCDCWMSRFGLQSNEQYASVGKPSSERRGVLSRYIGAGVAVVAMLSKKSCYLFEYTSCF